MSNNLTINDRQFPTTPMGMKIGKNNSLMTLAAKTKNMMAHTFSTCQSFYMVYYLKTDIRWNKQILFPFLMVLGILKDLPIKNSTLY